MDMQIIAIYFFAKDWLPDRLAAEHNLLRFAPSPGLKTSWFVANLVSCTPRSVSLGKVGGKLGY
jgi:hypothetical protein